jgi:hypothetical protein
VTGKTLLFFSLKTVDCIFSLSSSLTAGVFHYFNLDFLVFVDSLRKMKHNKLIIKDKKQPTVLFPQYFSQSFFARY